MKNPLAGVDWKRELKNLFVNHNYIFSLILLLIVGRIASDQFITIASLSNLVKSSVFIGIIALG